MKVIKIITFVFSVLLSGSTSFALDVDTSLLQGYDAALVVYNRSTGETVNIDPELSARRLSPCSTFKIYNTLIGLELGLIKGADEPWYKWDGVKRFIDGWNQNLTLREAFRVSAVPAYQILAREIGEARMKDYINKIGYGSEDISAGIDIFWLPRPDTTSIKISADEQAALLNKLLDGKLPFSEDNIAILRDVMLVEKTEKGALYGKTGSGMDSDGNWNMGWFVGFLESGDTTYVFACNITGGETSSGATAKNIVQDIFKSQGLL
ncbi:MAG: penicillin-binding transpeptidase domain-containing protein [Candidatus Omnitrophica bacterium]|jgi:beta-lactamase class D|nr:penicillin-binding transpeptidase domain-containing protein [Candidatus Omnitrophota bacterium]